MRRWNRRIVGALAATLVGTTGCHDAFDTGLSGAVITVVDSSGQALRSARTFALPDTIVELANSVISLDHMHDQEIVASVRAQLLELGWRDASRDTPAPPDVVVLTAATTRIQTGVVYSDWYGAWGYLPYWGPAVNDAWVWSTPDGAVPYAFPAGTLLVVMIDIRDQRVDTREIPLLWAVAVDGVISGASRTAERARAGIDQAFAQSAYLRRTP
jgi:hypothetical protein